MSLLQLPHAIWRDISVSWLGELRDVIRVDCASHFDAEIARRSSSSLPDAVVGQVFRFPDGAEHFRLNVLKSMCSWIQSRNVFISQLKLLNLEKFPHLQWEWLLAHTAGALRNVSFGFKGAGSTVFLSWASVYLKQLQYLKITGQVATFPGRMQQIVENNSQSLVSVIYDGCTDSCDVEEVSSTRYPRLQVLQWMYAPGSRRFQLLRGSSNLVALSVSGPSYAAQNLMSAIVECCPLLERLQLSQLRWNDDLLLQLAHGCPHLQYLKLWDHYNTLSYALASAVSALPQLHSLITSDLRPSIVLMVAASAQPALRVLNAAHTFLPYTELRQLTAALPQLTGFSVYAVDRTNADMLEHCRNMEHLELRRHMGLPGSANATLLSVATHCANLHTLVLGENLVYKDYALNAVIKCCTKLRRLHIVSSNVDTSGLIIGPGLIVSREYVELGQWAPDWVN